MATSNGGCNRRSHAAATLAHQRWCQVVTREAATPACYVRCAGHQGRARSHGLRWLTRTSWTTSSWPHFLLLAASVRVRRTFCFSLLATDRNFVCYLQVASACLRGSKHPPHAHYFYTAKSICYSCHIYIHTFSALCSCLYCRPDDLAFDVLQQSSALGMLQGLIFSRFMIP